ncbi:fibrinogen-like 2a [Anguilla rostrata]|uniref:fibrinogen-like 2a n=1 Tax=Anguilla rostrata TaxID=7938 RepID=UPI0030D44512
MRIALTCVCWTLLLSAPRVAAETADGQAAGEKGVAPGCPVRFKAAGQCGDGEECPYQVTLPPLTIQLPKQFRMLEKTMKELQSLKETVKKLKSQCQQCRQPADHNLQRDSGEMLPLDQPARGDKDEGGDPDGRGRDPESAATLQEMQQKMNRMFNSLKNARTNITKLQGRLEGLNLINMDNVKSIVDSKVENITNVISNLSKCSSPCPAHSSSQFIMAPRDCSDYNMMAERKNGVYKVAPEPQNGTFEVYCDMESYGGGWTVLQRRLNGSVNFNRTWAAYKEGFGDVRGEFWLGNDRIHQLTKAKDMVLRIELEDFQGVREYAKYDRFYISNEFLRYRLTVSGYSGTAGDALHFNKHYNHDQKFFTTPDKDNDMYPSGNCGAYYSSGWWFDACMSANLNGKYYKEKYKGVRNGIFWGTWHNMTQEYYPTNYRNPFKTVKMMIRPKNYAP